jgi:hypothetical protein
MPKLSTSSSSQKFERSGNFEGYEVVGWRFPEIVIWHIKTWPKNATDPAKAYVVAGGEFYPNTISQDERIAVLHLLWIWDLSIHGQSKIACA